MPLTAYPPFNPAHPPFVSSIDDLPIPRTAASPIGEAIIQQGDFDRVRDPAYLWQDMPTVTPQEKQRREQVKQAKAREVENYIVVREQYWERAFRLQFPENVEYEITRLQGIETTHQRTISRTTTETIGITLGLELSGDLFNPEAAEAVAAVPAFRASASSNESSGKSNAEFTYELARELRFERMDSMTYREEETKTTRYTLLGGAIYIVWNLTESLSLFRKRPARANRELASSIAAATGVTWTDRFMYREQDPPC